VIRSLGNQELSADNRVREPGDFGIIWATPSFGGPVERCRAPNVANETASFRVPPDGESRQSYSFRPSRYPDRRRSHLNDLPISKLGDTSTPESDPPVRSQISRLMQAARQAS
jgi:hypothetical protein